MLQGVQLQPLPAARRPRTTERSAARAVDRFLPRASTAGCSDRRTRHSAGVQRAGEEQWRRLQMQRLLEWKEQRAHEVRETQAHEAERLERVRRATEQKIREAETKRAEVHAWKAVKRQEVEEQVQQATIRAKKQQERWTSAVRRSTLTAGISSRIVALAQPRGSAALPRVQHEARATVRSTNVHEATRPATAPLPSTASLSTALPKQSEVAVRHQRVEREKGGDHNSSSGATRLSVADSGTAEESDPPSSAEASVASSAAKEERRREKQKEELRLWRQQQEQMAAKTAAEKEQKEKMQLKAWQDKAKALRVKRAAAAAAAKEASKPALQELPTEFRVQQSRTQNVFAMLRRDFENDLSDVISAAAQPANPEPELEPESEAEQCSDAVARFKVIAATVKITASFSVDSEVVGELVEGDIVEALEIRRNARGQARLRINRPSPAFRIDDQGNSVVAEAWASEATWPKQTPMLELVPPERRKGSASEFQFREGGGDGTAWDKRFLLQATEGEGRTDEWYICYQDSPELQQFMQAAMDPNALIVQVGCGNSRMAPALYKDGFKYLVNLDISKAVLAHMQMKYSKTHPGLAFIAGDATQTRWPSEIVDVIVDKGTLQSLLLLRDGVERVEAFAREMWRILRPGGRMIQIMGSAGMQLYLKLPDLPWTVKHKVIPRAGIGGKANVFTFVKPVPHMK